jgi:hypothetical protein
MASLQLPRRHCPHPLPRQKQTLPDLPAEKG